MDIKFGDIVEYKEEGDDETSYVGLVVSLDLPDLTVANASGNRLYHMPDWWVVRIIGHRKLGKILERAERNLTLEGF